MRDYKEIAERIRRRGDEILAERKRRTAVIMRIAFSASGICAAVIIGVGLWHSSAVRNAIEPHTPPNVVIGTEAPTDAAEATQPTDDEIIDATVSASENTGDEIIVTTVSDEYQEHISVITKTSGASPTSSTVTTPTSKQGRSASTQITTTTRRSGSSSVITTVSNSHATVTSRVTSSVKTTAVQTTAIQITTVTSDSGSAAINTTVTYKPPVTIPADIPTVTTSVIASTTTSVPMMTTPYAFPVTTAPYTTTVIATTVTTSASPTTTTTAEQSSGIIKDELPVNADYDDIMLPDGKTYTYSGWRWYAYDLTCLYDTELQYRLYGGIESVTAAVKVYYMSDSSVLVGYDESGILLEFDCT